MSAPPVSVIIPNYNHAPYLRQRIDSVLEQTHQDAEVIILDDASSDNSWEVLADYRHHSRIRMVFNETNGGCVSRQWNKGLGLAHGKYVWIAESDDYAAPTFLETMVAALEKHPNAGMDFCESLRVSGTEIRPDRTRWFGEFAGHYDHDFVAPGIDYVAAQMLFFNTVPNASSVVFRRSLAEQIGGADETFLLSGDWHFWIRLLAQSDVAYVAKPLNFYRDHDQTARHTHASNGIMIEEAYRISLLVMRTFPVSPRDVDLLRERYTSWYVETMLTARSGIPSARRRHIHQLAIELDRLARVRLWLRGTGLLWLWLGCRRRVLTLLGHKHPQRTI